jgi:hypothetical protein
MSDLTAICLLNLVMVVALFVQEWRSHVERREWTAERRDLIERLTGVTLTSAVDREIDAVERVWGTDEDEARVEQRRRNRAGWSEP